jgi:hypothetical protein
MSRRLRMLMVLGGLVAIGFGLACLNYTKPDALEHHRRQAAQRNLPAPGPGIHFLGAAAITAGAVTAGFVIGRRSGTSR